MRFTIFQHLSLEGIWSVDDPTIQLSNVSLTTTSKNFTADEVASNALFPLAISANVFTPGKAYVFRLTTVSAHDPKLIGFGEITLLVNAPPTSGQFVLSPSNGTAVSTTFLFTAQNWVDDPSGYPLMYGFKYSLDPSQNDYNLASMSQSSSTSSSLPAGLQSNGWRVFCKAYIADSGGATATVVATVNVTSIVTQGDVATVLSGVLDSSLQSAFSGGDSDAALKMINIVGSAISVVNCSGAADCI